MPQPPELLPLPSPLLPTLLLLLPGWWLLLLLLLLLLQAECEALEHSCVHMVHLHIRLPRDQPAGTTATAAAASMTGR
jgi:hypothetical protein